MHRDRRRSSGTRGRGGRDEAPAKSLNAVYASRLVNHERWDGAGYPDRLRGEEIPLEARILSVADAYEAMTADRPYRRALGHTAAVEELRRCAGTQFDPLVVDAFLSAIEAVRAGDGRGQVRLA